QEVGGCRGRTRIGQRAGRRPISVVTVRLSGGPQIGAAGLTCDQRDRHRPFQAMRENHIREPEGQWLALRNEAQAYSRYLRGGGDCTPLPCCEPFGQAYYALERVVEVEFKQSRQ